VTPLIVAEIRWFKSPTAKQTGKNKVSRMHVQMVETNEKTQVIIARKIHEFIAVFQVTKIIQVVVSQVKRLNDFVSQVSSSGVHMSDISTYLDTQHKQEPYDNTDECRLVS
jgi:hypothetical protein